MGRRAALPRAPRAAPALQRRPHAARQAEAVDRRGGPQCLEAVQLDAAPLEAALLQHLARGRIGHARAGVEIVIAEFLEEEIDRTARRLGAKAAAPVLDAEPITELGAVRDREIDADNADRRIVVLDQEHRLALQ